MADTKDLQYYLDHPDELPSDPAVLADLAMQINGDAPAEPTEKQDDKTAASTKEAESATSGAKDDPKDAPKAKEEDKPQDGKQTEEAPIATPDGKHTIPYTVLKTERERRQAAETAVQDLTRQVEEIRQQLAKGTARGEEKAADIAQTAIESMSEEELEALRTDFPVFGKVVDGLLTTINGLNERIETLTQREERRDEDVKKSVAETVQDHIDNEPVLAYLQTNQPELFLQAVEIDKALAKDAKFGDLATRFAKVAETMERLHGPFEGVSKKAPETKEDPKPSIPKDEARKVVEEKVKASTAKPNSLSDLPSGELPESDELKSLENATAAEIGDKLLKMTPDQRAAFLNRL